LEQPLSTAERVGRVVNVLFVDLDNFQVINDSLGQHLGDRILLEGSRRICNCLRSRRGIAARFGGNEFTILLQDLRDAGTALRVTKLILGVLRDLFVLGEHEVGLSTSVIIALSNVDTARPSDLLRNAGTTLYQAKKTKRTYEVFRPSMHTQTLKRLQLEEHLRRALDIVGRFEAHYQPQVILSTGEIAEMKALMRRNNPRRGLVLPLEFIQVAEETGLIVPIGEWVLMEACRQARAWRERRDTPSELAICVNLSMRSRSR